MPQVVGGDWCMNAAAAACCRDQGVDLAKLALQFAVK